MKISFNSHHRSLKDTDANHGFGYATHGMLNALEDLGYKVKFNDYSADVGIVFNHPSYAQFFPHQYNILYFPWESTKVKPGWTTIMDSVDELWTPSPWCASVFDGLTTTPVYVYEHGVDHSWHRAKRNTENFHFLHVGAEAARKNGWDVVRAFREAFPHNNDVELTLKMFGVAMPMLPPRLGRVNYINEDWSLSQLQDLYYRSNVFVYPSAGEGFGLTPLQAIATGMPTITVPDWAPYSDLLDPRLTLPATMVASSWPEIHPGKVYRHSHDDLVDRMRFAYDNYDDLAVNAYDTAERVHKNYDWKRLTQESFKALELRLK